ncbi:hypothetical protein [Dictyobacter formicarum]|uniref:Uncharacterized protein n=1 Tax=Dictyobacter formicarum TaxID=2778368 RepID=A0ABQ3VFH2_9CHLR|nr:hypothetical protein [Dictyobacter formicarum]GHO84398.1 hypothetical protein KSZ_24040 [Dictyobacter formicarum]
MNSLAGQIIVLFVSLETQLHHSHLLSGYFGHFYPLEETLLVASVSDLLCFDAQAQLQWIAERLGIDGVVITRVAGNIIYGEGEWDPPGRWRPLLTRTRCIIERMTADASS